MTDDLPYRYEERPRVPPTEQEAFDPATTWVNYWDVNPIAHGLTAVRWLPDREVWEVVEVSPPSAHAVEGDSHHVERLTFSARDVWDDPDDPLTGFADAMSAELSALGEDPLPNAEPFLADVTYYVAGLTHRMGDHHGRWLSVDGGADADPVDYWAAVPDVDPGEIEGVASGSLPPEHRDDD